MAHLAGAASLAQYQRELVKLHPEDVGSVLHSWKVQATENRNHDQLRSEGIRAIYLRAHRAWAWTALVSFEKPKVPYKYLG